MNDKTQRQAERKSLQIDLSTLLVMASDRQPLRCLGVDVSPNGLGVVGFAPLKAGDEVILLLNGRGLPLEVVWCKVDQVRGGIHHIGFKTKDVAHDLEKELTKAGLLKRVEAYAFPTHKRK